MIAGPCCRIQAVFVVEDVVEYVLPELASEMFAYIEQGCASGSRMVRAQSSLA